jgi:hypothetical protein
VPVEEEVGVVQLLLERGWAVSAGERFRYEAPPGIRITTATVNGDDGSSSRPRSARRSLAGGRHMPDEDDRLQVSCVREL